MMKRYWAVLLVTAACPLFVHGADLVRLTPETWEKYAPQGKEVDCIYGDYVLRNSHLIAVIAEPGPNRNANMTVRSVGGMIIDLTRADLPNDQLSGYFPNGMPLRVTDPATVKVRGDGKEVERRPDLNLSATMVEWQASASSESGLDVTIRYTLSDSQDWLAAETIVHNPKTEAVTQELSDLIRADRTFAFGGDEATGLFFASDDFFQQCYGLIVDGRTVRQTGSRNSVLQLLDRDGNAKLTLPPGATTTITRKIFPGANLLEVRRIANQLARIRASSLQITVDDPNGPVGNAKVTVSRDGKPYGSGRTRPDGRLATAIPAGKVSIEVEAMGRDRKQVEMTLPSSPLRSHFRSGLGRDRKQVEMTLPSRSNAVNVRLDACGYVVAKITDERGGPIPCKVAFHGQRGTPSPDYGPDSADTSVKNLVYSHNGQFRQEIGPGSYDVIVSYGPEYDAVFTEIAVERGKEARFEARLQRVVDTTGWISADFHSHSTPSGDNTSSQLGRVQNLLCEHLEFCPCTEHNRIDSYVPLLKKLGVEHLMGTCSGMELTGQVLPVNHQNAFPLLYKPRTQDGGGPQTDINPVVQIERLALWDGNSEKLVQENHPNLVQVLSDKDEDGRFDGGFAKMLDFMDVVEVHPLATIFAPPTRGPNGKLSRNAIFHWMQLLNLGYRIPGVVNTDAHYTFHDSGWLRNYLKSPTDDPAKVDTIDIVHTAEQGNIVMTTGPFMDVTLKARRDSRKPQGIPGDDVVAPGGEAELSVRVQCSNWLDINRVQVFLNGRPDPMLNFTRREHGGRFQNGVVKFEATLPLHVTRDTHVIVAAIGEGLQLGRVMGPDRGKDPPVVVSNPIFIDLDADGFQPNGDLLEVALPR